MATKFHIAMFCSAANYDSKKSFYTAVFGSPSWEGNINEGSGNRKYWGSKWDREDGLLFALLKNPDWRGPNEGVAHVGFMFDRNESFDAEIQKRGIDTKQIAVYPKGERQVFIQDEEGVEWEFACTESVNT